MNIVRRMSKDTTMTLSKGSKRAQVAVSADVLHLEDVDVPSHAVSMLQ